MSCEHYEEKGNGKHYKIDDKLKCELCGKQLTQEDMDKIRDDLGK